MAAGTAFDIGRSASSGVVPRRASMARVHDCVLGGKDHYPEDRAALARILAVCPRYDRAVAAVRSFARRAAGHLAASGIRQFVGLDSGLPARPMLHEVVRRQQPDARVVYVDHDRTAHVHRAIAVAGRPGVACRHGDPCESDGLLRQLDADGTLDLTEPVGVLCPLPRLCGDDVRRLIDGLDRRLAHGSLLAVSFAGPAMRPTAPDGGHDCGAARLHPPSRPCVRRAREQMIALLGGAQLLPPGLVEPLAWPDGAVGDREPTCAVAGLASLPAAGRGHRDRDAGVRRTSRSR